MLHSFSCWRKWGKGSLTLLPESFRNPGENTLPGRSMSRWERRVSQNAVGLKVDALRSDSDCLSIVASQPQTSCTTQRSAGRTASTETLSETTWAWSRGRSWGSSSPKGSASTSLTLSTSLIAGSRWSLMGFRLVFLFIWEMYHCVLNNRKTALCVLLLSGKLNVFTSVFFFFPLQPSLSRGTWSWPPRASIWLAERRWRKDLRKDKSRRCWNGNLSLEASAASLSGRFQTKGGFASSTMNNICGWCWVVKIQELVLSQSLTAAWELSAATRVNTADKMCWEFTERRPNSRSLHFRVPF